MAIVLRNTKGSRLTHAELDGNFTHLDTTKEPDLGNPDVDGKVLSSTTDGVRSWIDAGSGEGGDVEEAPFDGNLYARKDATWQQLEEVITPSITSPAEASDDIGTEPTIQGSGYISLYSSDIRAHRIFQVDTAAGDFTTPVVNEQSNTNNYTLAVTLDPDTAYKARIKDVSSEGFESNWSDVNNFTTGMVNKPSITSPVEGVTDVVNGDTMTGSVFSVRGSDSHTKSDWEIATDDGFTNVVFSSYDDTSNKTSIEISGLDVDTQHYARVRYYGADFGWSAWADTVGFVTEDVYIVQPTLTVEGSPSDVPEQPTLETNAFSVANGSDTHASTDWQIRNSADTATIWESLADTSNLTSIQVPADELEEDTEYIF